MHVVLLTVPFRSHSHPLAVTQACFEGVMHIALFMWTPVLLASASSGAASLGANKHHPPRRPARAFHVRRLLRARGGWWWGARAKGEASS